MPRKQTLLPTKRETYQITMETGKAMLSLMICETDDTCWVSLRSFDLNGTPVVSSLCGPEQMKILAKWCNHVAVRLTMALEKRDAISK